MEVLKQYPFAIQASEIEENIKQITEKLDSYFTIDYLKLAFSLIDLTTLNSTDSKGRGEQFAKKVNEFRSTFAGIPNVAAICVYPPLVKSVHETLSVDSVGIASVGAGFPSSQTYLDVKILECQKAVADGATDIDIVISLGTWLSGDYQTVYDEIKSIKAAIGEAHLKVILETGALETPEQIWNASIVAMEAGADFIKTSTGKMNPAATPEAVYVMCQAIKAFNEKTEKKVSLKPAGGMVESKDALLYLAMVDSILGASWLNNKMLRFGASRLANNLVKDIIILETGTTDLEVAYF